MRRVKIYKDRSDVLAKQDFLGTEKCVDRIVPATIVKIILVVLTVIHQLVSLTRDTAVTVLYSILILTSVFKVHQCVKMVPVKIELVSIHATVMMAFKSNPLVD